MMKSPTKKSDNNGKKSKQKKHIVSMGIQRKFFLVFFLFILIITITTTGVVYEYSKSAIREELRDHLVDLAKTCALMIDADKHAQLETPADMDTDNYEEIKSVLQSVMEVNPKIADIYTMVKSEEENIFLFVVDAYCPAIGDEYDIGAYPKMKKAFDGAIADCCDEGCSAYAPIYDEAGKATALLGVELYMDEILDEEANLEVIQDYLVGVVENAASEIDADKLAQLKTPEDEHTAAYGELKSILQSVKDKNPEIYEIYIMAESDKENILLYLVDVYEPPEIGEEYDVSEYPQMQLAFDGAIADEEITIDRWGAWLSVYAPIYDDNGTAVAIVGLDMDAGNVVIAEKNLRNRLILIFLGTLLLSLITSIFLSRHFTRPITGLVEGTKAISRGDFDHKVEIKTGDELETLGDAFNKMAQRVKNFFTETAVRKELENIMNTMTDTLIVVGPDGNIIKANKAAFDLLGYSEAELIGLPFDKILGKPKQAEEGKMGLEKLIGESESSVTSFETTYLTKDGKEIPVNFAASIMKDEKGERQGIVCNADDITERKRAEAEIKKEKNFSANIITTVPDSLLVLDKDLRIKNANCSFYEKFQTEPDEVIGSGIAEVLGDKDGKLSTELTKLFGTEDMLENFELYYQSEKLGERIFDITARGMLIAAAAEEEEELVVIEDITKRRLAEEALRESEERFRAIFKTAQDSIFIKDRALKYTQVNPAMERLFGLQASKLIGRTDDDLFGKEAGAHIKEVDSRVLDGEIVEEEHIKPMKGVPSTFHIIKVPMHDSSGEIIGLCGIARNITERKRVEEERKRLLNKLEARSTELEKAMEHMVDLEEVTRMKTEFLSITSHELRTPLTPMKAQLQMLQEGYVGKMNENQKKSIEIVLRNLTRLDNLIADILDISRMEAGRIKLSFESMDINDAVKEAIKMQEPLAEEKDIKISAKLADLPNIIGDAERLRQAIGNLLNNAIKFSEKSGKVIIETTRSGENVQFSITDYGIGISKADQKKLFKPFSQIDTSIGREHGGTGLGLAIVKGIIQAHNGKVRSESELGKGSTVYFVIPTKQKITEKEASYIG